MRPVGRHAPTRMNIELKDVLQVLLKLSSDRMLQMTHLQDLGRHVKRRPAQRLSQALRLQRAGEAEVADLEHRAGAGAAQQQVLRLQVPLRAR